jgi:DNA-binding transcriptional ArsR family regulator
MRAHNDMATAQDSRQPDVLDNGVPSGVHARGFGGRRVDAGGPGADVDVDELAAEVLGHLADPTRLRLIRLLAAGESGVSELTELVPASRSSVSQHLGRLRLAGLVRSRRVGRRMLYRVSSRHLVELAGQAFDFAEHQLRPLPAHHRQPIV